MSKKWWIEEDGEEGDEDGGERDEEEMCGEEEREGV